MLAKKLLMITSVAPPPPAPLTVSLVSNQSFVESSDCGVQFGVINIGVTGGTPPYSYSWSKVSGDGGTPLDPSVQDMQASVVICPGEVKAGTYSVTVTDSALGSSIQNYTLFWERALPGV